MLLVLRPVGSVEREPGWTETQRRLQPASDPHFSTRTLAAGNFQPAFFQERCTADFGFFLHIPVTKQAPAGDWASSPFSEEPRKQGQINKTSGLLQRDYYKWFS